MVVDAILVAVAAGVTLLLPHRASARRAVPAEPPAVPAGTPALEVEVPVDEPADGTSGLPPGRQECYQRSGGDHVRRCRVRRGAAGPAVALQAEAGEVLAGLNLAALVADIGPLLVTGSFVSGLMAWPELDVMVLVGDDFRPAD